MLNRLASQHGFLDSAGDASPGGGAVTPVPASAGTVLDPAALAQLRALDPTGQSRLVERVVDVFQSSAQRLVAQLEAAHAAHDLAGVRHVAHTLKSSSASLGGMKLSRLCGDIEGMIREDRVENLDCTVADMRQELHLVLQALRHLPGRME